MNIIIYTTGCNNYKCADRVACVLYDDYSGLIGKPVILK